MVPAGGPMRNPSLKITNKKHESDIFNTKSIKAPNRVISNSLNTYDINGDKKNQYG